MKATGKVQEIDPSNMRVSANLFMFDRSVSCAFPRCFHDSCLVLIINFGFVRVHLILIKRVVRKSSPNISCFPHSKDSNYS